MSLILQLRFRFDLANDQDMYNCTNILVTCAVDTNYGRTIDKLVQYAAG